MLLRSYPDRQAPVLPVNHRVLEQAASDLHDALERMDFSATRQDTAAVLKSKTAAEHAVSRLRTQSDIYPDGSPALRQAMDHVERTLGREHDVYVDLCSLFVMTKDVATLSKRT